MRAIDLQHLSKRLGQRLVLDDVSLTIAPGELFFLIGPSGCGKTTLLRHIAGFLVPDRGRIFFDQEEVTTWPPHRRETGMMFQNYALWPHLNVDANVAFGLQERYVPSAEIRLRVEEALHQVQLGGLGQRRISELSGGQQQRVALARALVIRPRSLLLDEPLSNLDARLRLEMRLEIRRITKAFGLTAVYVTHDREEALSMADRMAVMKDGRLLQVGSPKDLYQHPNSLEVAAFIGEANCLSGQVLGATEDPMIYAVETPYGRLLARKTQEQWLPLPRTEAHLMLRPEAIRPGTPSPESNGFYGTLVETLYLGASVQYRVRLKDGVLIQWLVQHPRGDLRTEGESLWLEVDSTDLLMLED